MAFLKMIMDLGFACYHMLMMGEKFSDIKVRYYVEFAHYFYERKDLDRARLYYEKATDIDPDNFNVQAGLAELYIAKQLYHDALYQAQKALANSTKSVPSTLRATGDLTLAIIYEALGEIQLADEAFKRVLSFTGGNLEHAYYHLSQRYLHFGNYSRAEHYCKEALKTRPDAIYLHDDLARIYWRQNKLLDARKEFETILQLTSNRKSRKYATRAVEHLNTKIGTQGGRA